MANLWTKAAKKLHPAVEKYTAGSDYILDNALLLYDVQASRAHAKGLKEIGILTAAELKNTMRAFDELEKAHAKGEIVIRPQDEDCHTVIENFLVQRIGETGKKIHTGRSRNDQVAVAMRLYLKDNIAQVRALSVVVAEKLLALAERYAEAPMSGYSHTQQAMLTTLGHYYAAHAESMIDDIEFLEAASRLIDKNPLGTAAGFGSAIPLDREYTTKELGFARVQVNSLYVQNSRGKIESLYLESLAQVMMSLGRFAGDMLYFTSQESGYFSASESITTGSSIMPHKRNLDPLEIMRGAVSVVIANQLMVKDVTKNLLSGYNRDGQLIKKPIIESTDLVKESLEVAAIALDELEPHIDIIESKIDTRIFTADKANEMVMKEGIPFRDAYKKAAEYTAENVDFLKNIRTKRSLGAPGNIGIAMLKKRLKKVG